MASHSQEKDFALTVLNGSLLDNSIDWISTNMLPDEVYNRPDLVTWAKVNLELGEIYSDSDLAYYASTNLPPEDVFHTSVLEKWAIDHGWVKFF